MSAFFLLLATFKMCSKHDFLFERCVNARGCHRIQVKLREKPIHDQGYSYAVFQGERICSQNSLKSTHQELWTHEKVVQ